MVLVRQLMRSLQRGAPRCFSSATAASTAVKSKGPPFARYFWYTTGIMLGIPGVVGGVFVYNLQTDDEFYNHFNDRYPDLIDAINEYVPLNESLLELAKREDIGPIGSTEDLINETVTVVAELQSHQKVRFEVSGSASQEEIEALALKQSTLPNDRVVAITFAEEGDEDEKTSKQVAPTTQEAWPPAPRVTWGSAAAAQKKSKKSVDSVKELRLQIEEIRVQQKALEESKYAGRDIDEADEEIAALEERKIALKEQLPRKRFLWIF
ncbi:TonB-dependent receptor protein [Phytophthora palmivora]|uniref:TonB-dependent receptor protein n=1 Tax=Phytophthora palmivora TaxID=4796 RepID=A0A2P4YV79_9STRA|nr:TonB-dependent receptor protein [Phytophthora palmivora]